MANYLEQALGTGVKFYASKSKAEALALATLPENAEPGAICFVSDDTGNYIILNGKIFGDGTSGTGGGGAVSSVNGKTGVVTIQLQDLTVVPDNKTLDSYFNNTGEFTPEVIRIVDDDNNTAVLIDKNGIKVNGKVVATKSYIDDSLSSILTEVNTSISNGDKSVKDYVDSVLVSIYKVKGSVQDYNSLTQIENPSIGDVYNLTSTDMNYVYTENGWDPLGGSIDLSTVYTKSEIDTLITNLKSEILTADRNYIDQELQEVESAINNINDSITNINTTVGGHTSSIATMNNTILNNTTNITNIATQLTWQ